MCVCPARKDFSSPKMFSSSLIVFPSPDIFFLLLTVNWFPSQNIFLSTYPFLNSSSFFLNKSKVGELTVKSMRSLPRLNQDESLFRMRKRMCLFQRRDVKCVAAKCKIPRRCDSQSMPSCLSFKPSRNLSWNNIRMFFDQSFGVTSKRDSSEIKSVMAFIRASLGV